MPSILCGLESPRTARGFVDASGGIFVPTTAFTAAFGDPGGLPRIWSLDFIFALSRQRFRQGPSSLYTFLDPGAIEGLARYCSHPDVLLFHRI